MTVLTSRRTTNFTIQLIWPNHTLLIRGKKFDVTGAMYTKRKLGFWNHSVENTICIAARKTILTIKADDSLKIKVNIWFKLPCSAREQRFLQAGHDATKGEKPLRATVCLFDGAIVHRHGRIN